MKKYIILFLIGFSFASSAQLPQVPDYDQVSTTDIIDGNVVVQSTTFYIAPYCFEENGGLGGANGEWSVGNGSTGAGIGLPIYHEDAEVVGIMFQAETFGTSIDISLRVNKVITSNTLQFTADKQTLYFPSPIPMNLLDMIAPETSAIQGTFTDGRVCPLVQYPTFN